MVVKFLLSVQPGVWQLQNSARRIGTLVAQGRTVSASVLSNLEFQRNFSKTGGVRSDTSILAVKRSPNPLYSKRSFSDPPGTTFTDGNNKPIIAKSVTYSFKELFDKSEQRQERSEKLYREGQESLQQSLEQRFRDVQSLLIGGLVIVFGAFGILAWSYERALDMMRSSKR